MFSLLKKEISTFFSSIIGYIVIIVFLLANGLIMWIFPSSLNILDGGYATIDTLFNIAPWVFLFLIPAVTMRLFAEEKRTGTIELLFTKPLTNFQIIFAKYLAGLSLVIFSLLPTLIYYFSVYFWLGDNITIDGKTQHIIDSGGAMGAYIGLFFLASIYVAVGIFASSITENQIVAFIVSMIISFFLFIGFESISSFDFWGAIGDIIDKLGINNHYKSMSRGVIDTKDVIYFLSMITFFLLITNLILLKRVKIKKNHIFKISAFLIIIIVLNIISANIFKRFDLTSEKRYTLSDYSKNELSEMEQQIYIKVYLDGGKLPIPFKKMKNSIKELLDEFKVYADDNIEYEFINLSKEDAIERKSTKKELAQLGVVPVSSSQVEEDEGQAIYTEIYPSAVITYTAYYERIDSIITRDIGLNLLNNDPNFDQSSEININNSINTLEYKFINEITKISKDAKPNIAFIEGHGELPELEIVALQSRLSEYYRIMRGRIDGKHGILDNYKAIVIAKPTEKFTEADKFVLDQYVMQGGKILWLVDGVNVNMDSILSLNHTFAMPANLQKLNIEDQIFKYGARVNTDILQDLNCSGIRLKGVSQTGEERDYLYEWHYFPVLTTKNNHVINKYINFLKTEFVSSVDTVGNDTEIKKTVLLSSSNKTNKIGVNMPYKIDFKDINLPPNKNRFLTRNIPTAVLLEGKFTSLYKGRIIDNYLNDKSLYLEKSKKTQMIVVGDGDVAKNVVKSTGEIQPLGFDKYSLMTFKGNEEFLLNAINYLCDDSGLMTIRARQLKLRLLDKTVVEKQKFLWQTVNVALPIFVVILFGVFMFFFRKMKYGKN